MKAWWLDEGPDATIGEEELRHHGVLYEALPRDEGSYQPHLDRLAEERGYVTQDEVALSPETENLDAICAKFADEHHHDDDEVRFVLDGDGIFDIRSNDDRWMRVLVEPGDLIAVPAGKHHRFILTDDRAIRCVRLFKNEAGWVPVYR